ncbi:MAG: hypothetical protein ABEJ65_02245 [bacterium]
MSLPRLITLFLFLFLMFPPTGKAVPQEQSNHWDNVKLITPDLTAKPDTVLETLGSPDDRKFLYQQSDTDKWDEKLFVYSRKMEQGRLKRKFTFTRDTGLVQTSHSMKIRGRDTCHTVINRIKNYVWSSAEQEDTDVIVPNNRSLFEVCRNVKSVSKDSISLQWENKQERKEFLLHYKAEHDVLQFTYKMDY